MTQQEQPPRTTMRIAVASITNEDADFPDAHFTDEWIRKTADGLVESLAKQGYTLAATPSPISGLDVEAQAESDYHGNIIWHVPVDIPGTYHMTLIEKATLNFDEPDFSDYSDEEQK